MGKGSRKGRNKGMGDYDPEAVHAPIWKSDPTALTLALARFCNAAGLRIETNIKKLYRAGPKSVARWFQKGIHWISDIPADQKLPPAAQRQLRALSEDRIVVEPGIISTTVRGVITSATWIFW